MIATPVLPDAGRGFMLDLAQRLAPVETAAPRSLAGYIAEVFDGGLWAKQRAICDAIERHRAVAVRSSHGAGKSFVASRLAVAYLQTRPHSVVITTAPTGRQVLNVIWRYIRAAAGSAREPLRAKRGHPLQTTWEIAADWYALGFKAADQNTDAFQGFHAEDLLLIIDEAAGVSEQIFTAAEPILTGAGARLLLIGNPTSAAGTFRRAFHQDRALYHTIKISAYDTPNFTAFGITREDLLAGTWQAKRGDGPLPYPGLVDPAWVARQLAIHGADSPYVRARVDAEFPDDAGDTLVPLAALEAADAAAGDLEAGERDRFVLGVDVARYGDDETSICLRRGPLYLGQESWGKLDTMETVGRIQHALQRWDVPKERLTIQVDEIGLGAGVIDRLKELRYRAIGINVGDKASDREKWPNLRHELWWQLRERFLEGRIAPVAGGRFDEVMAAQLTDIRYAYRSGYTMPEIESKDAAKRRGVKSPDRAEAVMLAYATPPRKEAAPAAVTRVGKAKGRW